MFRLKMNNLILIFAICISACAAHPQRLFDPFEGIDFDSQQQQVQQPQQRQLPFQRSPQFGSISGSITTTTPRSTAATTASPQYLACLQACPVTSEYNPIPQIDNRDNVNYANNGRLNCAIRCGQNVVGLRAGICPTQ